MAIQEVDGEIDLIRLFERVPDGDAAPFSYRDVIFPLNAAKIRDLCQVYTLFVGDRERWPQMLPRFEGFPRELLDPATLQSLREEEITVEPAKQLVRRLKEQARLSAVAMLLRQAEEVAHQQPDNLNDQNVAEEA